MVQESPRVWLNPPLFWQATERMSGSEKTALLDRVWSLAERRDFESLQRFDFITVRARKPAADED